MRTSRGTLIGTEQWCSVKRGDCISEVSLYKGHTVLALDQSRISRKIIPLETVGMSVGGGRSSLCC